MNMPAQYTTGEQVSSAAANYILKSASSAGLDLRPIVSRADINFDQTHNKVFGDRLLKQQFSAIYLQCINDIAKPVYARNFQFEDVELYCSCIVTCETLEHAIIRSIKFTNALNGRFGKLQLKVQGRRAILTMDSSFLRSSPEAMACDYFGFCFFYKFFSWLTAESLDNPEFTLAHKEFPEMEFIQEFLPQEIKFGGIANTIEFDAEALKKPIVRTNTEMVGVRRELPFELIAPPTSKKLSTILEGIFRRSLGEKHAIPSADQVAYRLNKSSPTLRRHLAQENTSYQEIADKCRKEKAIELLVNNNLTIDEISYWLGYSAPSGFSRAFKTWTGLAPSDFRRELVDDTTEPHASHPPAAARWHGRQ